MRGDGGVLVPVKVVPGARSDQIAGVLGDRLKIRVSAPPENGRANESVCRLIASALGVRRADVRVERGETSPEKTLLVSGTTHASADDVIKALVP
jgi:uncharacterized protein (TIGR00251 family)